MTIKPFELERYFARYEFESRWLLGSSDCQSLSIAELLALEPGAETRFGKQWLGYTQSPGSDELRDVIAALYPTAGRADVLVHAGAQEAIYAFMRATLIPGDHIIVHFPAYQSLYEVAQAHGVSVSRWEAHEERGWSLDLDELETLMSRSTRAVIVNVPHNPTGYFPDEAWFRRLIKIVERYGVTLLSDEVYRLLEYGAPALPAACDLSDRAVSLGVLSKTFGLPGLRIGWIATHNHTLRDAMQNYKDYLTICNSAPSEFLAGVALRSRKAILARQLRTVRDNVETLAAFMAAHAHVLSWTRPKAGPLAFARLREGISAQALCAAAAAHAGIMLLPSTTFSYGDAHLRIGFGRADFAQALEQFGQFLAADPLSAEA